MELAWPIVTVDTALTASPRKLLPIVLPSPDAQPPRLQRRVHIISLKHSACLSRKRMLLPPMGCHEQTSPSAGQRASRCVSC